MNDKWEKRDKDGKDPISIATWIAVKMVNDEEVSSSSLCQRVKQLAPNLSETELKELALDLLVKAAALTGYEDIRAPHHVKPLSEGEIIEKYATMIEENFGIPAIYAKEMLEYGSQYHIKYFESLSSLR